jgi:hypothetical protein
MKYAFITGDKKIKFAPIAVVFNNGKFEFICESFERKKFYYDYVQNNNIETLDKFTAGFPYQNIEMGDVTPDVESMLNKLRAKFGLSEVAETELNTENQRNPEEDRQINALLRVSKRMRTGANER